MKLGVHSNIPIEEYHADRHIISSTGLKEAKKSSRHFAYYLVYGSEKKSQFDFGNAFELALIDSVTGELDFHEKCLIYDEAERPEKDKGITSKKNQEWKKGLFSSNKYIVPRLGAESYDVIEQMLNSIYAEPVIVELLEHLKYDKSLVWKDECGAICKTRPDFASVNKNVIVNLKTTLDASPEGFARQVANYDYPLQAYMEIAGAMATGYMPDVKVYYWLAVEKVKPFNAVLYRFQPEDIQPISDAYDYYLKRAWKVITEMKRIEGDFHKIKGYSEDADNKYGVMDLELPLYYKYQLSK